MSSDSSERQYKSRNRKMRFDPWAKQKAECGEMTATMVMDACVDGFFVLDIFFRLFLFGQVYIRI